MTSAMLEASGVSVTVDGAELLGPTSLAVGAGECLAVLGPNGAGKTTLLRVLSGRLRPSGGRVALRGAPLDERRREVRREISALLEPPAMYPDLTLIEHLAMIAAAWSAESGPAQGLAQGLGAEALEVFGLDALRDRFPHELSSGQRQLVSLALAFARPADVLLLDEPEQRLDSSRRALVAGAMLRAREAGAAIVFASHDLERVERVADRRATVGA